MREIGPLSSSSSHSDPSTGGSLEADSLRSVTQSPRVAALAKESSGASALNESISSSGYQASSSSISSGSGSFTPSLALSLSSSASQGGVANDETVATQENVGGQRINQGDVGCGQEGVANQDMVRDSISSQEQLEGHSHGQRDVSLCQENVPLSGDQMASSQDHSASNEDKVALRQGHTVSSHGGTESSSISATEQSVSSSTDFSHSSSSDYTPGGNVNNNNHGSSSSVVSDDDTNHHTDSKTDHRSQSQSSDADVDTTPSSHDTPHTVPLVLIDSSCSVQDSSLLDTNTVGGEREEGKRSDQLGDYEGDIDFDSTLPLESSIHSLAEDSAVIVEENGRDVVSEDSVVRDENDVIDLSKSAADNQTVIADTDVANDVASDVTDVANDVATIDVVTSGTVEDVLCDSASMELMGDESPAAINTSECSVADNQIPLAVIASSPLVQSVSLLGGLTNVPEDHMTNPLSSMANDGDVSLTQSSFVLQLSLTQSDDVSLGQLVKDDDNAMPTTSLPCANNGSNGLGTSDIMIVEDKQTNDSQSIIVIEEDDGMACDGQANDDNIICSESHQVDNFVAIEEENDALSPADRTVTNDVGGSTDDSLILIADKPQTQTAEGSESNITETPLSTELLASSNKTMASGSTHVVPGTDVVMEASVSGDASDGNVGTDDAMVSANVDTASNTDVASNSASNIIDVASNTDVASNIESDVASNIDDANSASNIGVASNTDVASNIDIGTSNAPIVLSSTDTADVPVVSTCSNAVMTSSDAVMTSSDAVMTSSDAVPSSVFNVSATGNAVSGNNLLPVYESIQMSTCSMYSESMLIHPSPGVNKAPPLSDEPVVVSDLSDVIVSHGDAIVASPADAGSQGISDGTSQQSSGTCYV